MLCPDCGKTLVTVVEHEVGEYLRCEDCPKTVPFEELFDLIANVITGEQLENIVNFTVDLGYDVVYIKEGELARKGFFKKIYRPDREELKDIELPPNTD